MLYLWLARFGSFFAEHLAESIIAILVWKLTDSEVLAAMTIASGRVALWAFGLKAGHTADHANRATMLKVSMVITSLAFWAVALAMELGLLTAVLLGGLNFITF